MAGRAPRSTGLTKTQQLRQAKSAAFVREYAQKQETTTPKPRPEPISRKRRPPPVEPKKVDFSKPGLTKAMLARMKHAEKFKEDLEKKKQDETRRTRRTTAAVGGDARFGKERRRRSPSAGPSRGASPRRRRKSPDTSIPDRTSELARSMNADIIQAEPVGEGPIDSIVIPPGTVSDQRPTIVSIPQRIPDTTAASDIANRSIRVISETLDEQDAAESVAVQSRLADLQQARRDFVIAVANVGGNAVNIGEDAAEPARHRNIIYKIPDITDERLRIEYGRDHPVVQAAREFAQRTMASLREREAAREYERLQREPEDFLIDLGQEEDIEEEVAPWEEEDELEITPPTPKSKFYEYEPFDPDALERFFDVGRYPTSPCNRCPPGREQLHPDLWELDDPWYRAPEADIPDLIEFD